MEKNKVKPTKKISFKMLLFSILSTGLIVISFIKGQDVIEYVSQSVYERFTSKFTVEKVEFKQSVESNLSGYIDEKKLLEQSGIQLHKPIVDQDLDEVEVKLRANPFISKVQISTRLPNAIMIEYEVHQARAMVIQKAKPWFISSDGYLISPIKNEFAGDHNVFDLPLLSGFLNFKEGIEWLNIFETEFVNSHVQIHEIVNEFSQVSALIDLIYDNQSYKVKLIVPEVGKSNPGKMYARLNQVIQYLIKNNILVSTIDLRAGQKIVVIVGKNL